VAVIRCGRVCQCDTPQGLYDDPTDTEVAGFVGEANLVPGVFCGGSVRTAFGDLPCHCRAALRSEAGDAVVLIRPEQVKLCPLGPVRGLAGRVLEREYHGHDSVIRVKPEEEGGPSVILARISGQVPYQVGSPVSVTVEGPVVAWCAEAADAEVPAVP
jgi:iron(III) transport system ATP-binding protein